MLDVFYRGVGVAAVAVATCAGALWCVGQSKLLGAAFLKNLKRIKELEAELKELKK